MKLIRTLLAAVLIAGVGAFAESRYHFVDKLSLKKPVEDGYVKQLTTVEYEKNQNNKLEVYLISGDQKLPIFENEQGKIMVGSIDQIVENADEEEIIELFKDSGIRIKKEKGMMQLSSYIKDIYLHP